MHVKFKKKFRFSIQSQCVWLDDIKVQHALPNKFTHAIGPFVFLEHILSYKQSLNDIHKELSGKGAMPHRGITILTYSLTGDVEHLDSIGNHVKLGSGGVHYTKAGTGIVYNEAIRPEFKEANSDISVFRFWVNLPIKRKSDKPNYFSFQSNEIPKLKFDDDTGWIKILLGEYENVIAKIACYSKGFLYHLHLHAGKQHSIITEMKFEYAAFLPANKAVINSKEFHAGEFIAFTPLGEMIEIKNKSKTAIDIILFGGEPYNEPIVAEGNFVMNTQHEITQAYNDYYDGKYGRIKNS
jgi:redox-sensitive bicupin YhaK (pirin superfamily)